MQVNRHEMRLVGKAMLAQVKNLVAVMAALSAIDAGFSGGR